VYKRQALGDGAQAASKVLREVSKAMQGKDQRSADAAGSSAPGTAAPDIGTPITPEERDRVTDVAMQEATAEAKTGRLAHDLAKQSKGEAQGGEISIKDAGAMLVRSLEAAGTSASVLRKIKGSVSDTSERGYVNGYDETNTDEAVTAAVDHAMSTEGGGIAQAAVVMAAAAKFGRAAGAPLHNPFGKLAGLRVYKKLSNYGYVRRFKQNWAKHIPLLTVWDAACRLIARMAGIKATFRPGFVFNDERGAECVIQGYKPALILLNPQYAYAYIKAHKERPGAIAAYLMGIAAHEMAHLSRGEQSAGKHEYAHGDEYAGERERLGDITAVLGPAVAVLVLKLIPGTKDPHGTLVAKLTRDRDKARARARKYQMESARYKRDMRTAYADAVAMFTKKQPRWVQTALDPAMQARVMTRLRNSGRVDTVRWLERK
jgi:hypothetical protein